MPRNLLPKVISDPIFLNRTRAIREKATSESTSKPRVLGREVKKDEDGYFYINENDTRVEVTCVLPPLFEQNRLSPLDFGCLFISYTNKSEPIGISMIAMIMSEIEFCLDRIMEKKQRLVISSENISLIAQLLIFHWHNNAKFSAQ